ncbi:hypothetical protein RRG08_000868 [Elysia crispata]|uniref:Uncharacterized protein n=1 Tax=Elysia crispata TaxID=231223 RepID=A0AAE0XTL3_9GAST|nr:hypothetical protein RRG08_000868 [Elysia crispata]
MGPGCRTGEGLLSVLASDISCPIVSGSEVHKLPTRRIQMGKSAVYRYILYVRMGKQRSISYILNDVRMGKQRSISYILYIRMGKERSISYIRYAD